MLYDTAVLDGGYTIGDTNEYSERVFDVLTKMTGLPDAPIWGDADLIGEILEEQEAEAQKREESDEKEEQTKKETKSNKN